MADRELRLRILGDSQSAENALKKVENATQKLDPASKIANKGLGDLTSTLTSRLGPAGGVAQEALDKIKFGAQGAGGMLQTALAGGAAAGAAALVAFAAKGVGTFLQLTGEVRQFQRVSGASAEDSSKFVAATHALGIESDAAANGLFRLSRNIETHSDKLHADGIEIAKNAQGHTDLVGTLLNVADAYNHEQDQAKKNLIVFDAFGKSGATMIPILQRGREGLHELFVEAQKHGEVFNQADLDKGRQLTVASNELKAAWAGLSAQAGKEFVPELTQLAKAGDSVLSTIAGIDKGVNDFIGSSGKDADHQFSIWTGAIGNFDKAWHLAFGGGGKSKDAQQLADATAQETQATEELSASQQTAAADTLNHMVATGRLTQAQLDANTALHHTKDGAVDYAATLKDLDPTTAKSIDMQARFDAGLGDTRDGFQKAADAADIFKSALDRTLNPLFSAQEADLRVNQAERDLADSLKSRVDIQNRVVHSADELRQKNEDLAKANDDVKQKTIDLAKADQQAIDAHERDAQGNIDAAGAKAQLIAKLQDEQNRYPALRGEIQAYIDRINAIPPDKLFTPKVQPQPATDEVNAFGGAADLATIDRTFHINADTYQATQAISSLEGLLANVAAYDGKTIRVNTVHQDIYAGQAGPVGAAVGAPQGDSGLADLYKPPGTAAGGYFRARPGGAVINVAEGGADEIVATKADPAGGARLFHMLYGGVPSFAGGGYIRASSSSASSRPWMTAEDFGAAMSRANGRTEELLAELCRRIDRLDGGGVVVMDGQRVGRSVSRSQRARRLAYSRS